MRALDDDREKKDTRISLVDPCEFPFGPKGGKTSIWVDPERQASQAAKTPLLYVFSVVGSKEESKWHGVVPQSQSI